MSPRQRVVRMELWGNAIQVLGWFVLMLVAGILIVPGAWVLAAVCRWLCRNLRFSDGRTATFTGRGGEIVGWWVLGALCGGLRIGFFKFGSPATGQVSLDIGQFLLGGLAGWMILRWFVAHVEFDSRERFSFTGGYWSLLGHEVLVGVLAVTIIGWAWGLAWLYRWMAESTRSAESQLRFAGKGHQILWRTLVAVLLCVLIIPIPFAILWYAQWLTANTTIETVEPSPPAASS